MTLYCFFKWRDEALRKRESRGFPNLKDLVDFIEQRAEAANDLVFGRIGETKIIPKRWPPNIASCPKWSSEFKGNDNGDTSWTKWEYPNPTTQKGVGKKCYSCDSAHRIERCPDFISKSVRERMIMARYKGLYLNCLRKGHFASQCQSSFRCKQCQQPHHSLLHKATEDKEGAGVKLRSKRSG